jgi:MoaD family protein
MPRVRLRFFAAARDAAGCATTEIDAATVADALSPARATYGDDFSAVLGRARVWVNGDEPVDGEHSALRDGDEVAVIPPVSGG